MVKLSKKKTGKRVMSAMAVCSLLLLGMPQANADDKVVNVYNWGNAIGKETVANFEKATGIKVVYQEFDSNDTLQAKLLSGHSQYDVVVPSDLYWARQLKAGLFQKLDSGKLPNTGHLDPKIMAYLKRDDPSMRYGVPWSWGTDGLGINVEKVTAALGHAPQSDWELFFNPQNLQKLKGCGVSMLDSPLDGFGMALQYLKKDPNSSNPQDYQDAYKLLKSIRPYITQFNSSGYINDLAEGDVCIAFGWSGDVNTARLAALGAHKKYHIKYLLPDSGTAIWFDMLAIPKDAPHPDAAHKFINFVLSDKESASLTNDTSYPTAIPAARAFIHPDVLADPAVFPPSEAYKNFITGIPLSNELQRLENRLWNALKTGIN
ncbi:polyamine ABC transporter substrate-binding protein [Vogesella sp. LIG4]|uniref:polyamine ABC transporter substrate-binding protein n=1 Tax=Vogesella sp. LIG4 TaxID=1192162 RepID=UPI00081FD2A0|nr:polyamine ABC transporter substrate-binding protein [Vogesella sp. LIG4]SCK24300.1 putrescine transport system substrate-binding protein [Vogesella sp. LIG4]